MREKVDEREKERESKIESEKVRTRERERENGRKKADKGAKNRNGVIVALILRQNFPFSTFPRIAKRGADKLTLKTLLGSFTLTLT